jgi:hypothetical protein
MTKQIDMTFHVEKARALFGAMKPFDALITRLKADVLDATRVAAPIYDTKTYEPWGTVQYTVKRHGDYVSLYVPAGPNSTAGRLATNCAAGERSMSAALDTFARRIRACRANIGSREGSYGFNGYVMQSRAVIGILPPKKRGAPFFKVPEGETVTVRILPGQGFRSPWTKEPREMTEAEALSRPERNCLIPGCANTTHGGKFDGPICKPCAAALEEVNTGAAGGQVTGPGRHSAAARWLKQDRDAAQTIAVLTRQRDRLERQRENALAALRQHD